MKNSQLLSISVAITAMLSLCNTNALSQPGKWFGEAWILPVVASVGNHGVQELGLGYYDFRMKQQITQEYGLLAGRRFGSRWSAGIGVSLKNIRQQFGYTLRDPADEMLILENPERSYQFSFLGLRAFGGYTWDRHTIRLIVEVNDPYKIRRTPDKNGFQKNWLISSQGNIATMEVDERLRPDGSPYSYIIPEVSYGFQLNQNISLLAGAKWKWFGETNNYHLRITGNTFEAPQPGATLNYTRILNRFFMIYAGANFRLEWGKQ
ncbi:MAG: hypothetical protein KF852_17830 [Saprospiraceae bacterium]|nr:hypothetical protein [Saprospiraceae bacterium]